MPDTTFEAASSGPLLHRPEPLVGFAVVWSALAEPAPGEVILLPPGDPGPARVFGRGGRRPDDPVERVLLERQRPGMAEVTSPFENPFVSKTQLRLEARGEAVFVENLGRGALLLGPAGRRVTSAVVTVGETVEIKNQLVLLCIRRSRVWPALPSLWGAPVHGFGEPDAQGIVGESPTAWALRGELAFAAARSAHVLLLGPSGSGKELVAQGLHALSPRGERRLVARNAATLPAGLVDAELFGNIKNYPNPGMPERLGLIGQADGSTLFLDEIGELPSELQAHLLRVLDAGGDYQRLGDSTTRNTDIRLVAATNRAFESLKHDLAARFGLRIDVPGLDVRREDIALIARHLVLGTAAGDPEIGRRFVEGWNGKTGRPRLHPALVRAIVGHRYGTHVRELAALLWRSLSTSPGDYLEVTPALEGDLGSTTEEGSDAAAPAEEVTADAIRHSLARHAGVREKVWRELGLANRHVLKRLIKKYGIAGGDDE